MASTSHNPLGRPRGIPNKNARDLRAMMENLEENPDHLPIPVLLLKLGLRYHLAGLQMEGIAAISRAIPYAYPQLKTIEHKGEGVKAPNITVYVPDNGRGPVEIRQNNSNDVPETPVPALTHDLITNKSDQIEATDAREVG